MRALRRRHHPRLIGYYEPLLFSDIELANPTPLELAASALSDIYAHLPTLYLLTVHRDLKEVLELGTRSGLSTVALLSAVNQSGGRVTSIDIEDCPEAAERVSASGFGGSWRFIRGDDLDVEWASPIDHLFVDTSHTYGHTRDELAKFEPWVRPGGVITLHDVVLFPGVWKAITDHFRGRADTSVVRYFNNNGLAVVTKGDRPPTTAEESSRTLATAPD